MAPQDKVADASSVSRTLKACDEQTVLAVQTALDAVTQPFIERAVSDLRAGKQPLVLDADLTGRPVSATSQTYLEAAFGYMDGTVRLGYQLAQICVQTRLFGRQWLSAHQHPGSTVSGGCLLALVQAAEQRLGCGPRRRAELVAQRIAASAQGIGDLERWAAHQDQQAAHQDARITRLTEQTQRAQDRVSLLLAKPTSTRQSGPYSTLNRLQRQITTWQKHLARAQAHRAHAQAVAREHRERATAQAAEHAHLLHHWEQLCQDNARPATLPRCIIRLDAGFSSGENLTALSELGYDIETKSGNDALIRALQRQVTATTPWTKVGKNAEMIGWTNYHITTCPYPLTVGLERFHTPKGLLYAVLIRNQEDPQAVCPDLSEWFCAYNARQTIEAGNKEEKTTFKVQHLMSRSPAGVCLQPLLTVFAANFVRWASEWVQPRVEHSSRRFDVLLSSPKHLVRVAANSPAIIDRSAGRLLVRFSPLSSLGGVVVCLSGDTGLQLPLPLLTGDRFSSP